MLLLPQLPDMTSSCQSAASDVHMTLSSILYSPTVMQLQQQENQPVTLLTSIIRCEIQSCELSLFVGMNNTFFVV